MSALIKCRKCHRKFDHSTSLGKRGKPITTCRDCSEKGNAKKTESRTTTFRSLPSYDDFLASVRDFADSTPGSWKWQCEFRLATLTSNETLKDLSSAIARRIYEITGFRWT
jgi:hypothetical protein